VVRNVEIMPKERTVKNVFKNVSDGKGFVVKPRKRWLTSLKIIGRKCTLEAGKTNS
jgi:hypothetical protein